MPHLTHIEKQKLEEVLRMSGGYVLDFSDPTIAEFFRECVGVEIYSAAYDRPGIVSKSKANRMRERSEGVRPVHGAYEAIDWHASNARS
jgi:hypothetical protein